MLAGWSSTLLSPRLTSEASAEFQPCHFPSMSSRRLELPHTSFGRKETGPRSQSLVRPVGISIEKKPLEAKTSGCSLRQNIKLPPTPTTESSRREKRDGFWENRKSPKKRYADEVSSDDDDESYKRRAKRKRSGEKFDDLGHLGSDNLWFQQGFTSLTPFSITRSRGDEERICFMLPSDPTTPALPPLANVPWFDSVVTEVTNLGKTKVEAVEGQAKETSGSTSSSSESRGLVLRLSENPVELEIGNVSTRRNLSEMPDLGQNYHDEHRCVEILSLLVACVEQIGVKNVVMVDHYLARLGELVSPKGPSSIHRLVAYYTEALSLRAAKLWPQIFHITVPRELDRFDDESEGSALRLLNQVSPIPRFVHFTSNEILLRSFEGKERVHIIDFDIKQGLQWPTLFQSLASRVNPPTHVRITGVGESKLELSETGDRLARLAKALNLDFEFHAVVDRLEDVRLWMLHVKENEAVAVNCMFQLHKLLYDGTGSTLGNFIGLIRSTNAETVVVAEQEAAHNEPGLDSRLCNSLKYYSAMFDSIDSCLPPDSSVRIKIEQAFAREIRNIIACEGRDRFERHETFDRWRDLLERGGFRCRSIGDRELLQGQMLLRMYCADGGDNSYFTVEKTHSGESISLKWLDQPLYTVSAWSLVDVAGSSQKS